MRESRYLVAVLLCLLVAGCSDGSSGSDNDGGGVSDRPLSERQAASDFRELTPVTLDDTASTQQRPLSPGQLEAVDRIVTDNGEKLDVALAEAGVTLTPGDVDRPRTVTVALVNDQGERLIQFRVNLVNVAGEPVRERAKAWLAAREAVTTLAEDCAIAEVVAGAAYVGEELAYPEYVELREGWALPHAGEAPALTSAYTDLASTLNRYERGDISADGLAAGIDGLRRAAREHQREHGNGPVGEAYQAMPAWEPPPERKLRYDPPSGGISSVVGNASLGSRSGGRWIFDAAWAHLAALSGDETLPECGGAG